MNKAMLAVKVSSPLSLGVFSIRTLISLAARKPSPSIFPISPPSIFSDTHLRRRQDMGFLDKLWDETLAGPPPETGLGKLRKYKSLSAAPSRPIINPDELHVTRSITILKTNPSFRNFPPEAVSVPNSPAGSSAPESPFTPGTPSGDYKRDARRKAALDAFGRAEPRSPTVYDWIVISALDR